MGTQRSVNIKMWEYSDVGGGGEVYRCGNTVMWEGGVRGIQVWEYSDVGGGRGIQVWEYSDVGGGGVYRCGNTVMWEKRGVGT